MDIETKEGTLTNTDGLFGSFEHGDNNSNSLRGSNDVSGNYNFELQYSSNTKTNLYEGYNFQTTTPPQLEKKDSKVKNSTPIFHSSTTKFSPVVYKTQRSSDNDNIVSTVTK